MDWRRRPGTDPADPHGVADLLARACEEVSSTAVEGTRFLFTTEEMLRVSREIEQASMVAPGDDLLVGVQRGHRLEAQADVYRSLTGAGVRVRAFGVDGGTSVPDVTWVRVRDDPHALEACWFLVRAGADPHALVGFELTSSARGRRRWEGFESRDARLVEGIAAHLHEVAAAVGAAADGRR
jgi:hypothetical protein